VTVSASPASADAPLVVLKLGGSVLTGLPSYFTAASFVARRLDGLRRGRIVAVVSAERGQTDALLQTAREFSSAPDRSALDLLWSTGELRSVALLVLALQALGVNAAPANVHQTGLLQPDASAAAGHARVVPLRLRALLAAHDVVVVPGFLARGGLDSVVSLGRGGSDLTAVLLAAGLGARICELVKDVDGYYSADPNVDAGAEHLSTIAFERALSMADADCGLVQREALEAASRSAVPLVIRSIGGRRSTTVGVEGTGLHWGNRAPDRPGPPSATRS
jgi:aspartokinase